MELVTGKALSDLLNRVRERLPRYREVLLCTPFLDDATVIIARDLVLDSVAVRCGVRLITRPEAAEKVLNVLPGPSARWCRYIESRPMLHAKVYCAIGRPGCGSEAIVTSANLTTAGMMLNEEIGIRVTSATSEGRQNIARIRANVNRLTH